MKIQGVANRGIGQFCVMLRDDAIYRDRCAARVAAGRADHLVKFSLEEELKPRGKLRAVSRGRFAIIYPDHDRALIGTTLSGAPLTISSISAASFSKAMRFSLA